MINDKQKTMLITGFVPGYPNADSSLKIAEVSAKAGADILELSASFSEPIADGHTLQLAHQRVLAGGFSKLEAFGLYKKIGQVAKRPLFLIEYANIIYQWGFDRYYRAAARAGIDYLAVPDVPLEESAPFAAAKKHDITQIFLVAPTTPDERVRAIARAAKSVILGKRSVRKTGAAVGQNAKSQPKSFLYLISVTGVTGSRQTIRSETTAFIKRVRRLTDLPLIVGFGISRAEHLKQVIAAGADGIVTCSPIVDIIHQRQNRPAQMLKAISSYVNSLNNC